MNWKEFLRPTISKLALAALIFIISTFFVNVNVMVHCPPSIQCFLDPYPETYSIAVLALVILTGSKTVELQSLGSVVPTLAIAALVSYILACFLAYFYPKIANRGKK